MKEEREKIKRILKCFQRLEQLFEFSTSSEILNIPKFIADTLTTKQKTEYFILENDTPPNDLERKIAAVNARIEMWELKFQNDPNLKEAYVKLSKRIEEYVERFGYDPMTAFEERIEKAGVLKPIFERPKLKPPWIIMPEQYVDFRTDLEYEFLVRKAFHDGMPLSKFPKIKADLKKAVANAEVIFKEYDLILRDRLIKEQLENTSLEVSVYNIAYDRLQAFNAAAMKYL